MHMENYALQTYIYLDNDNAVPTGVVQASKNLPCVFLCRIWEKTVSHTYIRYIRGHNLSGGSKYGTIGVTTPCPPFWDNNAGKQDFKFWGGKNHNMLLKAQSAGFLWYIWHLRIRNSILNLAKLGGEGVLEVRPRTYSGGTFKIFFSFQNCQVQSRVITYVLLVKALANGSSNPIHFKS